MLPMRMWKSPKKIMGRGLSAEDIAHIIGEKGVYDSRAIGMKDAADPEELKRIRKRFLA